MCEISGNVKLCVFQFSGALLAPNPKGLGAYNLGSVRPSVRTSGRILPWTAISQKCMDQIV